ncbi:MAG: TonB-dependent receptor [Candidatus Rokubacteria bacterium]|nr:TonB-dependent receptor [Candidatus Rokubacteria bacterium]
MQRVLLIAVGIVTATALVAGAQEVEKLEPVVVTATKLETPAAQLGSSVTVVTEEELKTYHYATLDEAVRAVPGLEIRRSGSLGKTTSLTIRGANANQVQVLLDGVRVKSPTTGQAEISDISPELIERIEVIRGPQSTLYGADAIGGVVNIITKKGKGPFSATVHQEAGNYDTLNSRTWFSGSWQLLDYAFSASHLESNGQFQNDGFWQNALNLRLGLTLPRDSSVAFTLRYNRTDTDLPTKFVTTPLSIDPVIDTNNRQESETLVTALQARTRPLSWWETELRLGRYTNTQIFVDRPDPGFDCFFPPCEFPSRLTVERREVEWLNHVHLGRWSTSSVGLEYRDEMGDNQGGTPFHAESDTKSVFFQQQLRFFDRLFTSAGFRVEDNSVFGTSTTERGSLAYLVKSWGTKLRGGAGSGFRAPTFNDLFFPGFSDRTLKPEESFSYDVGVDQQLWGNRVRLGLTYFQNEFTNLISIVSIATAPFVKGVNAGKARSAGIEFTSEVDLLDTLVASLNYTYTDSEILATRHPIPREPAHRWNFGLTWEPLRRLSLFTQVHVVTQQWEPNVVYNSGHTRVDLGGSYRLVNRYAFLQALDLTARVQNALNEGYAEVRGFPALGINALVGLKASF